MRDEPSRYTAKMAWMSLQRGVLLFTLATAVLILLIVVSLNSKRQAVVRCANSHLEQEWGLTEEAGW